MIRFQGESRWFACNHKQKVTVWLETNWFYNLFTFVFAVQTLRPNGWRLCENAGLQVDKVGSISAVATVVSVLVVMRHVVIILTAFVDRVWKTIALTGQVLTKLALFGTLDRSSDGSHPGCSWWAVRPTTVLWWTSCSLCKHGGQWKRGQWSRRWHGTTCLRYESTRNDSCWRVEGTVLVNKITGNEHPGRQMLWFQISHWNGIGTRFSSDQCPSALYNESIFGTIRNDSPCSRTLARQWAVVRFVWVNCGRSSLQLFTDGARQLSSSIRLSIWQSVNTPSDRIRSVCWHLIETYGCCFKIRLIYEL